MPRPRKIDHELVQKAQTVIVKAKDLQELRAAQAVLLPALLGTTLEQTASLLGVARATVPWLQVRFRQRCDAVCPLPKKHGGRWNVLMIVEEERVCLAPWVEEAKSGGVLVISVLRAALAQRLGRPVAASRRDGWHDLPGDEHGTDELLSGTSQYGSP
jgi:hypothetical protein